MNMHSHDQEAADLWYKGLNNYENLSRGEQTRFIIFMGSAMRILSEQFYQWKEGALDKQIWEGMKGPIEGIVQHSGFREYWKLRHQHYSDNFQAYVEESIKREPIGAESMYG
jgi:hypothetical protein